MNSPETEIDHRHRVKRVMMHISRNLDGELRLRQLAEEACYSPFHFIRVFENLMGETPQQYIIRKRMERAGLDLLEGEQRIINTALDVGYETHNSFCKVFKNFYGMSPARFRDGVSIKWFSRANRFYHPVNRGDRRLTQYLIPIIKILPQINIAYIENRGITNGLFISPDQNSLNDLKQLIVSHGLEKCVMAYISVYPRRIFSLEDDTAFRYKGVVVDRDIESLQDIQTFCCLPGRYAIFRHYGPYDFMPQTWNMIFLGWLPASGRRPRGENILEIYLTPPLSPIHPRQLSAYLLLPIH
jgi:AraC family transcriptional regulator